MTTEVFYGLATLTVGTEKTLATSTAAGVYQVFTDLRHLYSAATPAILEIRLYEKTHSSVSSTVVDGPNTYVGGLAPKVAITEPLIFQHEFKYTLKQTQGATAATFNYSVRKV